MLKNPKWIGITFLVFIALALSKPLLDAIPTAKSPEPALVQSVAPSPSNAEAEAILSRVGTETRFKPRFDTWGNGRALLMVDSGWQSLTEAEKSTVIEYVERNGAKAIIVGALIQKEPENSMMLDRTVWGE